ncbi:deoxycytidylate deaminase [Emiliania huxleyi virus 202]|nr:deoxycytidylate deaminase [Emiliania huxleyi virus 202]
MDLTKCMSCVEEKRPDYIAWDQYFMGVAKLSAMRSKDPNTQVGSCIIEPSTNKIVSIGYNGFPRGCNDDEFPWGRKEKNTNILNTKYPFVVHSEANSILNANGTSVNGCTMYVTLFPCNECTKLIIQSGIAEIVFFDDYADSTIKTASLRMLQSAGVSIRRYEQSYRLLTFLL